jgi:hypothetical protein
VSRYRSEHLSPDHDFDAFDGGTVDLDDWLRCFAWHAETANTGRTFVWTPSTTKAARFYRRFGFRPCPDPYRLVRRTSEVATALGTR